MKRLSGFFSKSETLCRRCKAMCSTRKGLVALVSREGYQHHTLEDLSLHSGLGCKMCSKTLDALEKKYIGKEKVFSGRFVSVALGSKQKTLSPDPPNAPSTDGNGYPSSIKSMQFLQAVGFQGRGGRFSVTFLLSATGSASAKGLKLSPTHFDIDTGRVARAAILALQVCSITHPRCLLNSLPRLPTRVIDVGKSGDVLSPKIHIGEAGETARYACLSYCWGGEQQLSTTEETLKSYSRALEFTALAQTIQDAIKVTRVLGIRYLWVDALCILQDDAVDKALEIEDMGSIYSNATLTIAAAGAKSVSEGFLDTWCVDEDPVQLPFLHSTRQPVVNLYVSLCRMDIPDRVHDWPLENRAWALQEYLLSPRLLIFGSGGPIWQCQSQHLKSIIPIQRSFETNLPRLPDQVFDLVRRSRVSVFDPVEREQQDVLWRSLVENYSARKISFATDRVPAIAGITRQLTLIWDDQCNFGIWNASLFRQLIWVVMNSKTKRSPVPNVPSWSWLRVNAAVKFDSYLSTMTRAYNYPAVTSIVSCRIEGPYLIITGKTFLPPNEMTKERICGAFASEEVRKSHRAFMAQLEGFLNGPTPYYQVGPLIVLLDVRDAGLEKWEGYTSAAYVVVASLTPSVYAGLVLMPNGGLYERIGVFLVPGLLPLEPVCDEFWGNEVASTVVVE